MDIEKQLEVAAQSDHLVLIVFYADWSPHYEWIGPVLRTYERRVIELINVNIEENKTVADSHNIDKCLRSFCCIKDMNCGGR